MKGWLTMYTWVAVSVILLAIGAWPISFVVAGFGIFAVISKRNKARNDETSRLKAEIEALNKKIEEMEKRED
jgi:uncharacterized membrane protein